MNQRIWRVAAKSVGAAGVIGVAIATASAAEWYTGADMASAKDLGPGSVVRMPANWAHVSGCRSGSECVFYQHGKGRFDFKPVPTPGK
jgi:hypothetical protein